MSGRLASLGYTLPMDHARVPEIDVHEARRRLKDGSVLIDVREEDEHAAVRTPDARLVPMSTFAARFEDEVPSDGEVMVLCRSGGRSARVALFLRERGIDAVNVAGGIEAWAREGFPVEEG